jgi:Terminase large subunit, T4likevirus-type, N-terminal/Terminase RNaseH-like domain
VRKHAPDMAPSAGKAATLFLPMPHAGQQRVHEEMKRFNALVAGRRWRKTTYAMALAAENALRGRTEFWGAPTYDQVSVAFNEMMKAAVEVAHFTGNPMGAEFKGGGKVIFRSLDNPDNARGHTADDVFIDEYQDVDPFAWSEVLRPMLMDTHGTALLQGTPRGRNHFYDLFQKASDKDHPMEDWAAWQIPTLGVEIHGAELVRKPHPYENSDISMKEIESLFRDSDMSERSFRQEILAEFVDDGGGVFRKVTSCATVKREEVGVPCHGTFAIGIDWGRSNDFTVCVVMDTRRRRVLEIDRFSGVGWDLQFGRVRALVDKWKIEKQSSVTVIAEDNNFGQVIMEALQRERIPLIPFHTDNATKTIIIDGLAQDIERGRISYPYDVGLINELQAYEEKASKTGMRTFGAPAGKNSHDDRVMALALVAYYCRRFASGGRSEENPFVVGEQELDGAMMANL